MSTNVLLLLKKPNVDGGIYGISIVNILTLKACRLNYVCDVVDSIPKEIRERIITEHPECANIDLLVKFWETKGDSLVSEIVQEQIYDCELTEYLKLHPEENN